VFKKYLIQQFKHSCLGLQDIADVSPIDQMSWYGGRIIRLL